MPEEEEFFDELDLFQIHLPGRQVVNFGCNQDLRRFMNHQYPNWKNPGYSTSIPIGRIPRVFLHDEQLNEKFKKRFKNLQRGESGEINIYQLLMDWGAKESNHGICLFPNVDGNLFKPKNAHVEIDTIICHPNKGIFVFNIKNALCIKESSLASDMKKHVAFIQNLCNYKYVNDKLHPLIPIHGIICSLKQNVDESLLDSYSYYAENDNGGKWFVMQPKDIKEFSSIFSSIVSKIPCIDNTKSIEALEVVVARLAVLNSMEGILALLHEKVSINDIQRIYVKSKEVEPIVQRQLSSVSCCKGEDSKMSTIFYKRKLLV